MSQTTIWEGVRGDDSLRSTGRLVEAAGIEPASPAAGSSWRPRVWPSSRRASAAQVTAIGCAAFEIVVLGAFVAAAIAVAAGVWPWVAR